MRVFTEEYKTGLDAPPPEFVEWMRFIQKQLGLAHIDIRLSISDRPGGDIDNLGITDAEPNYIRANIQLNRTVDGEFAAGIILHEMYHVATARMQNAVEQLIDLLPRNLKEHARRVWADANEPNVETLSRATYELLRAEYYRQRAQSAAGIAGETAAGEYMEAKGC